MPLPGDAIVDASPVCVDAVVDARAVLADAVIDPSPLSIGAILDSIVRAQLSRIRRVVPAEPLSIAVRLAVSLSVAAAVPRGVFAAIASLFQARGAIASLHAAVSMRPVVQAVVAPMIGIVVKSPLVIRVVGTGLGWRAAGDDSGEGGERRCSEKPAYARGGLHETCEDCGHAAFDAVASVLFRPSRSR